MEWKHYKLVSATVSARCSLHARVVLLIVLGPDPPLRQVLLPCQDPITQRSARPRYGDSLLPAAPLLLTLASSPALPPPLLAPPSCCSTSAESLGWQHKGSALAKAFSWGWHQKSNIRIVGDDQDPTVTTILDLGQEAGDLTLIPSFKAS